jgi:mono/diheme cytochrome c family protein
MRWLADWATPIAGLNVRPTHMSAEEYYALPIENLRTYPVYVPGREPDGYWEMLQHVSPQPLIEPAKLKSEADWISAGRRVFEEADIPHLRTLDPKLILAVRNPDTFKQAQVRPLADGTVSDVLWVPTKNGIALSFPNCANCHELRQSDGTPVPGAPTFARRSEARLRFLGPVHLANRVLAGEPPFFMGDGAFGTGLVEAFGVPWRNDDVNKSLLSVTREQYDALNIAALKGGGVPRWNGSPYYPTKVPDLIGIRERRYIDHTATHLHRGIGDIMRYAALVSSAETVDFGPYHVLGTDTKKAQARLADEALYALALYIYSLQPPRNPNPFDERAQAGQKIFEHEGCPVCHTPPLYTSNRITLAQGFEPPKDIPPALDVLRISVGTDPGLALRTRKGTGYYKVPSLKGVWYRGHYLHDGSTASLEEMFDPDRLKETHVPGGFSPVGVNARAIKGHEFGLNLKPTERNNSSPFCGPFKGPA